MKNSKVCMWRSHGCWNNILDPIEEVVWLKFGAVDEELNGQKIYGENVMKERQISMTVGTRI